MSGYQGFSTTWSTSTNVSKGTSTTTDIKVTGLSIGSYTTTAIVSASACSSTTGGGGSVRIPTKLLVANDPGNVQGNNCAVAANNGKVRLIQYQLADNNGNTGPVPIQEDFSATSTYNSCGNGPPSPTACGGHANAQGVFTDRLATNYCSATLNNSCGFALRPNHWQTCVNNQPNTISSPNYYVEWVDITINGVERYATGQPVP